MTSRSTELRRSERRVYRVSLGIAFVVHGAAFGLVAWSHAGPQWSPGQDSVQLEEGSWTGTPVDVFFGPTRILESDGTLAEEPPDHILEAARILHMPPECLAREIPPSAPGSGQVRLTVNSSGRIDAAALDQSTGDSCWDLVAVRVARDLWYHWLPNEQFPAPLEVLQPVTVGLSQS